LKGFKFSRREPTLVLAGVLLGLGVGLVVFALVTISGGRWGNLFKKGLNSVTLAPRKDSPAPDFSLPTLSGETVSLKQFRGKPVVLNFWATWCLPCREEMPLLQKVYAQNEPGLEILAINNAEADSAVRPFAEELGLSFPVLLDSDGAITRLFRVSGFPASIFIDSEGIIRYQHVGILSPEQLHRYLTDIGLKTP
jgi:cytochrome c biogenesis protein CcmG, thiol:disulfide interchange protein DsbE